MALKKITPTDNAEGFKFEKKGDKIDGYYIKTTEVTIDGRPVKKHIFKTAKGLVSVLGQFQLGQQLAEVPTGSRVVAVLLGIQKLKAGKTMKLYDVSFDDEDGLDSGTVEAASEAVETELEEVEEDDVSVDSEEEPLDVAPAARATPPKTVAKPPTADAQARVQALLAKSRSKSA